MKNITNNMVLQPKVSVIIPVYNTAGYLESALLSVVNQTLKEIELIIINDGSTDNSWLIIEEFQKKDPRIKYYYQVNQGQSVARNKGLDNAIGDYVYFMDSDDILEKNALEICYQRCKTDNLDFCFFDADVFSEDGSTLQWDYIRTGKMTEQLLQGYEAMDKLFTIGRFRVAPWLLFIRKEFIEESRLRFFPGIIHEDELFTTKLFVEAKSVALIPHILFHRRVRPNSTMTKKFSRRNAEGYLKVIEELRLYSANISQNKKVLINREIALLANSLVYQAEVFSLYFRMSVLVRLKNMKCLKYVKCKNFLIIIFPHLTRIKPYIIRPLMRLLRSSN
ncbi:MAG: glycosyltransferase [Eubacteriales bacterium]|nr:glycosyltransferase [Eubacteriales bacterium]